MIVLGIESTSHTSSVGLSQDGVIKYVKSHTYKPDIGGINPRDAADHHRKFFPILLEELFDESGIKFSEIDKIAFSVVRVWVHH
jgi:Metal-dependent proteases with possible chaperone activity